MFGFFNYKNLLLLLFILFISNSSFGQKTRISKIIDSNLFELANGKLIKLANVDVPNINNKDFKLQSIAVEAYRFAKENLVGRNFNLIYPLTNSLDTNYGLVYIIRKYPLITIDFTEKYLQNGYGKFINNVNDSNTSKYLIAEQIAKNEKKGIWNINNLSDTLDQTFLGQKLLKENAIDSIKVPYLSSSLSTGNSITAQIFIETMASPVLGIVGGFLGSGAGAMIGIIAGTKNWGMFGYVLIGASVGYLAGSSFGTYTIAKNGNRDVTYGYTLLSSVVGGIAGIYLSSTLDGFDKPSVVSYVPLAMPVIATIIYANLIAPKKEQPQNYISYKRDKLPVRNYFTHNDFYNGTKLIEVNLFRINF